MTENPDSSSHAQDYEGYLLDAENAAEMARLMLQDHMLTKAMGGPLPEQTDLSQTYQVLDIGCGPGGWLLDVTQQYPHIHGVGIDISQLMIEYANALVASQAIFNAQFRVIDATKQLPFPDHTFDLVNGRILTGFLLKEQWSSLLQECSRITKPGGIARFTEAEWGFTNSPAYDQMTSLCYLGVHRAGHSFSPHGRTYGTATMLRSLLRWAGYHEIEHRAYALDYSAGTPHHTDNIQNLLVIYKLLQPFLAQVQVATQEELEQIHQQMEEEMNAEDFCATDYFLTVWGHKPENSRAQD